MRLAVHHLTRYRFAGPMRGVAQSHRLMPASFDGQRVIDWEVAADGAVFGSYFADAAGDILRTMTVLGPVEDFTVEVSGTVDTADTSGVLRGHRETVPPMAYLRTTRATRPDVALGELVASVDTDGTPLDTAHAVAAAVADAIRYEPGRTGEATTAAEALAEGAGVCQDHAHALVAASIIAGLPARYVAGYLLSAEPAATMPQSQTAEGQVQTMGGAPDDREALRSGEASHAWAEIWVSNLGWVGFDAANRCCPDDRYIRLGSGFDAAGAAPIRGVAQGVAEETLDVTVAVQQVQQ
jgi:transglutaminase-like putative cysteine protease